MKAAGGISSYDDMVKFLDLGCERLGTSSGVRYVVEH
jgi:deoxyribose-phosphate aldolase